VCLSTDQVKPKAIKLEFVISPLMKQHSGKRANMVGLESA
jgi:hypothetical protein